MILRRLKSLLNFIDVDKPNIETIHHNTIDKIDWIRIKYDVIRSDINEATKEELILVLDLLKQYEQYWFLSRMNNIQIWKYGHNFVTIDNKLDTKNVYIYIEEYKKNSYFPYMIFCALIGIFKLKYLNSY